jgi:hypothetical protein
VGYEPAPPLGDEASTCKVRVPQAHDGDEVTYNVVCGIASGHAPWHASMVPRARFTESGGWGAL